MVAFRSDPFDGTLVPPIRTDKNLEHFSNPLTKFSLVFSVPLRFHPPPSHKKTSVRFMSFHGSQGVVGDAAAALVAGSPVSF